MSHLHNLLLEQPNRSDIEEKPVHTFRHTCHCEHTQCYAPSHSEKNGCTVRAQCRIEFDHNVSVSVCRPCAAFIEPWAKRVTYGRV